MSWIQEIRHKLSFWRGRDRFDQELDEEIRFHFEERADELVKAGMARREALAQAKREFGGSARVFEDVREAWQFRWIEDLFSDLRYATRAIRRDPGFALTAIVSLALGIGVNTTIFSVTSELLFSRPSARAPETLASVRAGGNSHVPMREFRYLQANGPFAALAGIREEGEVNWNQGGSSYRLSGSRVTDNYFEVLGVPLQWGRPIQRGDRNVVVLTHRFWQSRLAAIPDVLGRSLVLDGQPHTVIGVLPADHHTIIGFGFQADLYLPVNNENTNVGMYGRIPAGLNHKTILPMWVRSCASMDQALPSPGQKWAEEGAVEPLIGLERLGKGMLLSVSAFFAMLMLVVGLLLMIACANVASLLLARAVTRAQELAVRLSLGASRQRIVRQLLAESLLLAVAGTLGGLALNFFLTRWVNGFELPIGIPIRLRIEPDVRLLWYAAILTVFSAVIAGLIPALKASRRDVHSVLKSDDHQVGSGAVTLRNALVVGQLAVSVIVLTTAFLFVRNLIQSTQMHPGFDVEKTLWVKMRLVPEQHPGKDNRRAVLTRVRDEVARLPHVDSVSFLRTMPLNDRSRWSVPVQSDLGKSPVRMQYIYNAVGPAYFRAMGIPLVSGREFQETDRDGTPKVVIINETFAKRLFGDVNPLGHTITINDKKQEIIGVARNSKYFTLSEVDQLALYDPYLQVFPENENIQLIVRADGPVEPLVRPLEVASLQVDPSSAVEVIPVKQATGFAMLPSRAGAFLLGSIGLLGLVLASIGLYGVLVYAVARRVREIGLRVALGASRSDVLRLVGSDAVLLVGVGVTVGIGVSLLVTRPLAMFLVPGLATYDPVSYAAVVIVLTGVGIVASLVPTLRALRVDPLIALRYE